MPRACSSAVIAGRTPSTAGGGGIGLSIVRRLCALYDWNVRVVPGEERGVVATLSFRPGSGNGVA